MQKSWIGILLALTIVLSACTPAATPAPATVAPANTAAPAAVATAPAATAPAATAPAATAPAATAPAATAPAATAGAAKPTATPNAAAAANAAAATIAAATKAAQPTKVTAGGAAGNCTVVSLLPEPEEEEAAIMSVFPAVSKDDHVLGKSDAKVTFVEYSDHQCPYCSSFAPVMTQLQKDFPNDVRVVFRHFPLPMHDKAMLSAQATEAAALQGKFWEMSEVIFAAQSKWSAGTAADFETWVTGQAKTLGLDEKKFATDLKSAAIVGKITKALEEAQKIGIPGTPFVTINGRIYQGPRDLTNLATIVRLFIMAERQFDCPAMTINVKKQYTATLKTEKGDIVLQLFPDKAPVTVNAFVFLARKGWFDNIIFHRVLPNLIAQTGDPSGSGFGGPGFAYIDEITDLKFDKEGMVGMVNSGENTNGSQFFITLGPVNDLSGKYTAFGQVIKGMDVVKKLTERDPSKPTNLPAGDKLIQVTIEEK